MADAKRVDAKALIEWGDWHYRTSDGKAGFDKDSAIGDGIRALGSERDAAEALLLELLREAVILSDGYLEVFRDLSPDATIQGWDKARWMRAASAGAKARAMLTRAGLLPLEETT